MRLIALAEMAVEISKAGMYCLVPSRMASLSNWTSSFFPSNGKARTLFSQSPRLFLTFPYSILNIYISWKYTTEYDAKTL